MYFDHRHNDDEEGGTFTIRNITSIIIATIAVGGLLASFFWTLSDLKIEDTTIKERLKQIEIVHGIMENRLAEIDRLGTRKLNVIESIVDRNTTTVAELHREVEDLKNLLYNHDKETKEQLSRRRK